jgi:hypothetical protein
MEETSSRPVEELRVWNKEMGSLPERQILSLISMGSFGKRVNSCKRSPSIFFLERDVVIVQSCDLDIVVFGGVFVLRFLLLVFGSFVLALFSLPFQLLLFFLLFSAAALSFVFSWHCGGLQRFLC